MYTIQQGQKLSLRVEILGKNVKHTTSKIKILRLQNVSIHNNFDQNEFINESALKNFAKLL